MDNYPAGVNDSVIDYYCGVADINGRYYEDIEDEEDAREIQADLEYDDWLIEKYNGGK